MVYTASYSYPSPVFPTPAPSPVGIAEHRTREAHEALCTLIAERGFKLPALSFVISQPIPHLSASAYTPDAPHTRADAYVLAEMFIFAYVTRHDSGHRASAANRAEVMGACEALMAAIAELYMCYST